MRDLESYRSRLIAMRDRLRRQIDEEVEEARESIRKPGEAVNLHTHNADMDVEGLDNAVGVSHALQRRLGDVEQILVRLEREGAELLKNKRERERIDAYLDTEDFATRLRDAATNSPGSEETASHPTTEKRSTKRSGKPTSRGNKG